MKNLLNIVFVTTILVSVGSACSVIDHSVEPILDAQASWALLPIVNHTATPQAGRRAEAITEALLYSEGVRNLQRYPSRLQDESFLLGSDNKLYESALNWAKEQEVRYAMTGTVDEWRYKVGIDGEPAVGVSLRLLDLTTNTVVWSAVGGQSGWSREAVSAVAQKLIKRLLDQATFA
ncbi:MAG: penicillin-binding protein activator LpoB [Nitrospirales bacterium]